MRARRGQHVVRAEVSQMHEASWIPTQEGRTLVVAPDWVNLTEPAGQASGLAAAHGELAALHLIAAVAH
eukprot:g15108.t1